MSNDELRAEIIRLAPWHLDVEVNSELSTAVSQEVELTPEQQKFESTFIHARESWVAQIQSIYPDGLAGRTVLDCACNCGAYSFWMKEMGSGGGLGFDVRQHWIDQARFLQAHREAPADGLRFEVSDVMELMDLTDEQFDITIFKGIFYHLPDPIHALKMVADRTKELLFFNSGARTGLDDGMLVVERESVEHPMSGVHGLCFLPTGPEVVSMLLESVGFPHTRTVLWNTEAHGKEFRRGRVAVVAARGEAVLASYDEFRRRREQPPAEVRKRQRTPESPGGKPEEVRAHRERKPEEKLAERERRREERKAAKQREQQALLAERVGEREAAAERRRAAIRSEAPSSVPQGGEPQS